MTSSGNNSAGKPTVDEWNVIYATEQFYKENRYFPGTKVLVELTELTKENISEILGSSLVQKRFEILGIDVNSVPLAKHGELKKNQTRLSDKQLAVAETMLNPMDKRNHTEKLRSLGVPATTYQGWMSNKVFSDYVSKRAEDMFGGSMYLAQEALVRKVMRGDTGAMKLYFEMTGKYKNQAESNQDFKMLVLRLIEILQKYIKDPQTLQLVAEEIKILTEPNPARSVTQGEIIYDNDTSLIT